jgi:hypothetical protein
MWRQISLLILGIFISACRIGGGVYYGTYETPDTNKQDQSVLAILDWSACKHLWRGSCGVSVQRFRPSSGASPKLLENVEDSRKYSRIVLEPGTDSVRVGWLSGGFMERDQPLNKISGTFVMLSGHKYVVKEQGWSMYRLHGPFVLSWWIEDEDTGLVMAGRPPPEKLPWYQRSPL